MNILLTVAYDGTNFFGWQKQENLPTIQLKLEEALSKMLKQEVLIRGASRTDAGVHSIGQLALFKHKTNIPIEKIPTAINGFLTTDEIVVTNAIYVQDDFHPQNSVYKKTYKYYIYNNEYKNPLLLNYSEFVKKNLDIKKMQQAAKYFIGEFDFVAFCSSKTNAKTTVRTIYNLEIYFERENLICIEVTGNGFLYNMVRIIAGTLINVGIGKTNPDEIPDIISSKDRQKSGKTASAKGLVLYKVFF